MEERVEMGKGGVGTGDMHHCLWEKGGLRLVTRTTAFGAKKGVGLGHCHACDCMRHRLELARRDSPDDRPPEMHPDGRDSQEFRQDESRHDESRHDDSRQDEPRLSDEHDARASGELPR